MQVAILRHRPSHGRQTLGEGFHQVIAAAPARRKIVCTRNRVRGDRIYQAVTGEPPPAPHPTLQRPNSADRPPADYAADIPAGPTLRPPDIADRSPATTGLMLIVCSSAAPAITSPAVQIQTAHIMNGILCKHSIWVMVSLGRVKLETVSGYQISTEDCDPHRRGQAWCRTGDQRREAKRVQRQRCQGGLQKGMSRNPEMADMKIVGCQRGFAQGETTANNS